MTGPLKVWFFQNFFKRPTARGRCIAAYLSLYSRSITLKKPKTSEEQRHVADRCRTHFATLPTVVARPSEEPFAAARAMLHRRRLGRHAGSRREQSRQRCRAC